MRLFQKNNKNENGLASIVVVGLLIILLTLITIGFARIMTRSVQNATSNETAASASYAAQSGLNDLADFLRTNPDVKATKCNDLIQDASGNKGPFFNDANVSGDNNTRYTCLLVNQRPTDLAYQNITNLKSKVIKLTTDTVAGSVDSYMFSWQSRDPSKNVTPNPAVNLIDETSWNNSNYIPMLRVTLYPISTGEALDDTVQNNSRTIYLIPSNAGGPASKTIEYLSITNGEKKRIKCDTTAISGFTGSADYSCNFVINGLASDKVSNINYYYVRLTPIYNNVDIKVKGNDVDNRAVKFKNVQAVLDVTAKAGPAAKRLQSRVDIAGIDSSGNITSSPNLSPALDEGPDFSLRSASAICKRYKITNDVYDYLTLEGACPTTVCAGSGCGTYTPPPQLTMNVNGVDSQAQSPNASYLGVSYISGGGTAQINWNTIDATSCVATNGSAGWPGEKKGIMAFTPTGLGSGSQSFPGITSVTPYTLTCTGPGSGVSPGVARTVRAWPHPTVVINGPASIQAGTPYQVSWTSNNSSSCDLSGSWTTNGNDSNPSGAPLTKNQTMNIGYQDDSTKTFTITCTDPSGRSTSQTRTYSRGGANPITPPDCTANVSASDTNTGRINYSWSGACPNGSPGLGTYRVNSSTDPGFNSNNRTGSGTTAKRLNDFCLRLTSSLSPWGDLASNEACAHPDEPGTGDNPECTANINWVNNGNGSAYFNWNGACPTGDPGSGYYLLHDCSGLDCSSIGAGGWVGSSGTGPTVGTGTFCVEFASGADPWGWQINNRQCIDIHNPVTNLSLWSGSGLWDQSPQCGPAAKFPPTYTVSANNTWWCHWDGTKTTTYPNGGGMCADGVHKWTMCDIYWSSNAGSETGSITCQISGGLNFSGGASGGRSGTNVNGGWGWNGGNPNPFILTCSTPWASASQNYFIP